ncbi:vWA domain-containing protein [Motiliproteus sediminis]|uniref:vWA domain-containing protein n=1 Tax=Motiliproteus sediminis TaxID=1468178 RepID=UPI001AEF9AEA|nr:VWA domain-containing protein [Motiliproteus sediminis]
MNLPFHAHPSTRLLTILLISSALLSACSGDRIDSRQLGKAPDHDTTRLSAVDAEPVVEGDSGEAKTHRSQVRPPQPTAKRYQERADRGHEFAGQSYAPPSPWQPMVPHELTRERYAGFNDNPSYRVSDDPLSTFAIDVDTASYTLARQSLGRGQLPAPESVRTEEWVNFFRYDYPRPSDRTMPFSVTTELAPAPWDSDKQLLLIGLQGYEVPNTELPPLNLTFLIDVSGSMSAANKLPLAKQALKLLTAQLRPEDRVAIVVYAGAAGQVLPSTPGDQRQTILNALEHLHAGGSTAGGAGIQLAYATARQHHRPDGISRVILLSDGDFNVGTTDTAALKRLVAKERQSGVSLSVLTFGRGNIRDELMNALAETGNGNAAFIDNAHEARRYLVDRMSGSMMTIAKDVKVQLEFNPAAVASYRLLGYETRHLADQDFDNDRKDAGEIGAGHSVTALYELTLTDSPALRLPELRYQPQPTQPAATTEHEIAFLKLRYKQPGGNQSQLISQPVTRELHHEGLEHASANLRWAAAVAGAAQLARGLFTRDDWSYDDSIRLATGAAGNDSEGYRRQFIHLMRTAAALPPSFALQHEFESTN